MRNTFENQPNSFWGHAAVNKEKAGSVEVAKRAEVLKLLDRDTIHLGDINPLIHPTNLVSKESCDAISFTILEKIDEYQLNVFPTILESTLVVDPETEKSDLRFIARFEVPELTEGQMLLLEELVRQTYGPSVRTRKDSKGNNIPTGDYPPTQPGIEGRSKTGGWYMGPDQNRTSSLHAGLFVYKDLGPIKNENFLERNQETPLKYIVEIREAGQYQTDLVAFVTQVAAILGKEQMLDQGKLLYDVYYNLMRMGLKRVDNESIYGMDEIVNLIRRGLLTPLASPDLSRGIKEDPESVLMVGVPGTGKTLVVEQLLNQDTGLFILPLDPLELQRELIQPKLKQRLLPRIAEVARITGKKVVLHIDDIENIVEEHEDTHSTMLNLMAGVKESGFFIIASTNKPEKIDEALMQPQRFGILIHCGLQSEAARFEILKIHSNLQSQRLQKPLFHSEAVRDAILRQVAKKTDAFTPRYLAAITRAAKSYLVARVAMETGTNINLAEENLDGQTFELADWDMAFQEVAASYDRDAVKQKDEELKKFVNKHSTTAIGFGQRAAGREVSIFPKEVEVQIAALIALALAKDDNLGSS